MADKLDRVKFAKVCEMMTSSHEGERSAATVRANAMLKAAGLSWTEALKPVDAKVQHFPATPRETYEDWMRRASDHLRQGRAPPRKPKKYPGWTSQDFEYRDLAKLLFEHECLTDLDDKHQDFIGDMAVNETRPFTEAQRKYLDNLAKQLDRRLRTRQHTY